MTQENYLFYHTDNIYSSAKSIYGELKKFLPPINSLADIGCGMAAFAKVFQEDGIDEIILIDHPSIDVTKCLVKEKFKFIACDLDKETPPPFKVDVIICTEVLEHVSSQRSLELLDFITSSSSIVIFSAAIPRQEGLGHINEKRHGFWIEEFKKRGFAYSDAFKAGIIQDQTILFWLRQNLFIFYKRDELESRFKNQKFVGDDFEVVSKYVLNKRYSFKEVVKMMPKAFTYSFSNFLRKL
jgi:2-polyprenyl-3-methyl-5-hydroxy-6-metoxy-1,4-benzoquinol methylase